MTKTISKRNIVLSIGSIAAALVIGIILWVYYMAPSSYLALDVNPSIEIHTNRLNQVTSIEPVNEDAKQLMAGYELTDRNLEVVIRNIVDRIILSGYIALEKDNTILITTDDIHNSTQISDTVNGIITKYLAEKQLNATVIPQSITVTSQSIEEAHDNYVSVGKMAIIQELIASDSTLTIEQLSTLRISDLVLLAENKNISLAGLFYSSEANVSKDLQANTQIINSEVYSDIEEDSDTEDQGDNDIEDRGDSDNEGQEDNNIEDREDGDNEDQNKNELEDSDDGNNDDQDDNDFEDREDGDNEDQDDNDFEDREDGDNEDQDDNDIEDHEEGDNEDQGDNDIEDREDGDNDDQGDNDHEDQNHGDREGQKDSEYED